MLYHTLAHPGAGTDIEQIVCTLSEEVDADLFAACWRELPLRHPVLRTRFVWQGLDEPRQIATDRAELPVERVDFSTMAPDGREAAFADWLERDRARGFDVAVAPLSRVTLVHFGPAVTRAVWTCHHLLVDGRSFALVLGEVFDDYDARRAGRPWSAPQRPAYADYLRWIAARDWEPSLRYWRGELEGFAAPTPLLTETGGRIDPRHIGPSRRVRHVLDRASTAAIRAAAAAASVSANNFVQAAWAILLARYAGTAEVVFGVVRACRRSHVGGAEEIVGVFMNTLPLRVAVRRDAPATELLRAVRERQRSHRDHEHTPLVLIQQAAAPGAGGALFKSVLVFDDRLLDGEMRRRGQPASRRFELHEKTGLPVTVYAWMDDELTLQLAYDGDQVAGEVAGEAIAGLAALLQAMARDPEQAVGDLPVLGDEARRRVLSEWNATARGFEAARTVHEVFAERAARRPEAAALVQGGRRLGYGELDEMSARLAAGLAAAGVGPGAVVGLCTSRSPEMVVGMLGILRAGAAWLPLDPDYPAPRLAYIVADAGAEIVLADAPARARVPSGATRVLAIEDLVRAAPAQEVPSHSRAGSSDDLAYVIYTSGSTGDPKGVMVTHRNLQNFFAGMDDRIGAQEPGTWLAVTSLSFDISVLELLWTLTRGFEVVLYDGRHDGRHDQRRTGPADARDVQDAQPVFSLFYFASDAGERPDDKYRLLLEGARFADRHGFAAVWTPERHFHAFGGLYPNPAVVGAAIAAATERVRIRAGSVVLPLHNPLRVAEEWSVVDNLSGGRVGISIASGWHPNDFVLAPDRYRDRKEIMLADVETIRRLWRGEAVRLPNPVGEEVPVAILPRPIQRELPVWVTAAGNPDTFRQAGAIGANLLTHLLGQSLEEVAEKIGVYRAARRAAGHAGEGTVTLMLHTFVGDDFAAVRDVVRGPMRAYLRSAVDLIKRHATAWSATARPLDERDRASIGNLDELPAADMEALLDYSFERYFEAGTLFGTPETCLETVARVRAAGVDEIACLIDFGVPAGQVLESLPHLERLRRLAAERLQAPAPEPGIGELIRRHGVTHLQCTPSMAAMLVADPDSASALGRLRTMLVGGEPLPAQLAARLLETGVGELHNMYGPTETTIWSTTARIADGDVTIGRPIANTRCYVLDDRLQPVPVGTVGELFIAGDGVARGYRGRPELTAGRFLRDPFHGVHADGRGNGHADAGGRMYRTGDLVRHRSDGVLEILGRVDQQVKVRGHRIELGEIEHRLERRDGVRQAVVVVRDAGSTDAVLQAHVVRDGGAEVTAEELLRGLRDELPEWMVPAAVRFCEALPATPNGKIDRRALAQQAPVAVAPPAHPAGAPAVAAPAVPAAAAGADGDATVAAIAAIWRDVLQVEQVGPDVSFFDLGGHSLLTIKLQNRLLTDLEASVPLVDLFRFRTVRAQAARIRDLRAAPQPETAAAAPSRGADRAARRRQLAERRRT